MTEDKLTHDERLRLECVAQAIARSVGRSASMDVILTEAKAIENHIKGTSAVSS